VAGIVQGRTVYVSFFFWFLVNVNNYKPARPPLGGYQEVSTIEQIARRQTILSIYNNGHAAIEAFGVQCHIERSLSYY